MRVYPKPLFSLFFLVSFTAMLNGCAAEAPAPSATPEVAASTWTANPPPVTPSPATPSATPTRQTPVDWLSAHAIPFSSTDPGSDFSDLAPMQTLVGDARIVSLGEATHGTSEFFTMKHRILEYLVEEMGFTVFAIEAGMAEAELVNQYVLTGRGNPKSLLIDFPWPWYTQEVLDLVEWMRAYNESRGDAPPVYFAGFDMQRYMLASNNVIEYLQSVDPGQVESAKSSYACLRKYGEDNAWAMSDYPKQSSEARTECRKKLQAVYDLFTGQQDLYRERSSAKEVDWFQQNARILLQFEDFLVNPSWSTRDRYMAENVSWLADTYHPGARMVLWSHNQHAGILEGARSMGYHLREKYGDDVVLFGFSFYRGGFNAFAVDADGKVGSMSVFELDGPFPDGIENYFHQLGVSNFFLDLRGIEEGPGTEWLLRPSLFNSAGALFAADYAEASTITVFPDTYDVLIHIEDSTPSHLLGMWGSIPTIHVARAGPAPASTSTPTALPAEGSAIEWNFENGSYPWGISGNKPASYRMQMDHAVTHGGTASVRIRSVDSSAEGGFASFSTYLSAAAYRGKTVRLSAFLRTEGVAKSAGLWARVEDAAGVLGFINSDDHPVAGDSDWILVRIEFDVPEKAATLYFGAILNGAGTLWVDDVTLEAG